MSRNRRAGLEGGGDAIGWIAYTDFVTALALVFVTLFIFTVARFATAPTIVDGEVTNADNAPVGNCEIFIDIPSDTTFRTDFNRTDSDGTFTVLLPNFQETSESQIRVRCYGYQATTVTPLLLKAKINPVPIKLGAHLPRDSCRGFYDSDACETGLSGIEISSISGGAFFATDQYGLSRQGEDSLRTVGNSLSEHLTSPSMVLAILGHTDDRRSPDTLDRDHNWILSAERAAAAAQFLVKNYPEYKCRIIALGVGPSRPKEPVNLLVDDLATLRRKRAVNRRLEFRVLNGSDLSESMPSGC